MLKKILPKDDFYFDQFDKMVDTIIQGVNVLKEMIEKGEKFSEFAQHIKTIEHHGDQLVHETVSHLHKTFITPFDREDIHELVNRLDDIIDLAEVASSRIDLYQPRAIPREVIDLTNVLVGSVQLLKEMLYLLRNLKDPKHILELTKEIKRLEDKADYIRRSTMARLFRDEQDVRELIKWKDILEYIERATDRCEDVADVTEGIVLEHT